MWFSVPVALETFHLSIKSLSLGVPKGGSFSTRDPSVRFVRSKVVPFLRCKKKSHIRLVNLEEPKPQKGHLICTENT